MIRTNAVLNYVKYLDEQIETNETQLKQTGFQNRNEIEEKLKMLYKFKKIFTMDLTNYYFENIGTIVSYIIKSELYLHIKLECICYIFNVNKEFFNNQKNIERYIKYHNFDTKNQAILEFNRLSIAYKKLVRIIDSRNKILSLKYLEDEEKWFKIIGFSDYLSGQIIDTALRNYQLETIYQLKKAKN